MRDFENFDQKVREFQEAWHNGPAWERRVCLVILAMIVAIGFLATPAHAATDPRCYYTPTIVVSPDPLPPGEVIFPPVDVIDADRDDSPPGSFAYCTPTWDENGLKYPETGAPMVCEVIFNGEVIDRQEGLAPGQLVSVLNLTVRWNVDELLIACSNSEGVGVAFARPATFPKSRPGSPFVPSD